MPPASDGAEKNDEGLGSLLDGLNQLLLVDDVEIALAGDTVAQPQDGIDLPRGSVHGVLVDYLRGYRLDGNAALGGPLGAEAVVGCGDGHKGLEVVDAQARSALAFQHSDNGKLASVHTYRLAHRVSQAEKLLGQLGPQHRNGGTVLQMVLGNKLPRGYGGEAYGLVAGRHADNRGGGVQSAVYNLCEGVDFGGYVHHCRCENRVHQSLGVL